MSAYVDISYTIDGPSGMLNITVDTTDLPQDGVTEVVVMNEQGARHFDQYCDASGNLLRGKEIGCWDEVTAEWASFVSVSHGLAFTLRQLNGAKLFRGRELIGSRLAWSGFGYSFPSTLSKNQLSSKDRKTLMSSVLLIYPFFKPSRDRSVFRFPPLGVSYLAASLQEQGHEVRLLDCTFLDRTDALNKALAARAEVVGIYCMVTMIEDCLWFAGQLRDSCKLLVVGGPLPTCDPLPFLEHFDVVVSGEGEQTMIELLRAYAAASDFSAIPGIIYRPKSILPGSVNQEIVFTDERPFEKDLDRIPFPARELLPNQQYIQYGRKKYGYSITTVMSTRGCPYRCEFCSNVVFGGSYRERSPENVVDEIEEALALGYDRISFGDDVFTLKSPQGFTRLRRDQAPGAAVSLGVSGSGR